MKVEVLKPMPGKAYFEGDVFDLPTDQARAFIESGHCIPAKEEMDKLGNEEVHTTESPAPAVAENAMVKTAKGKGKR